MINQENIYNQFLSDNPKEIIEGLKLLKCCFSLLPDKQQAWSNLHKLVNDKNSYVRSKAAFTLSCIFYDLPDKQQVCNDLHILISDEDRNVRYEVAFTLGYLFSDMSDKRQVWNDLIKLTTDENWDVRHEAAFALHSALLHMPDKQQAWNDLHKLINDKDSYVRYWVVFALGHVFSELSDKEQAWNDLHILITDENELVRYKASTALVSAFPYLSDKQQAWNDLIKLTTDKNWDARYNAASALVLKFSYVPDKEQAWNDLIKLITDKNNDIRFKATSALNSAFPLLPNKQQAWNDLIKLVDDQDSRVRSIAFDNLAFAFTHVPDKQQAWNDLIKLITDKNWDIRIYLYHCLGKISIFKASQAEKEEDYKKELEEAIAFFEKASHSGWRNPAQFCLPFYRSFYTILFKKQEAKEELNRYLAEAKGAVSGSKSKELLFEAVNNLANALKEVQSLENLDLETTQRELNFYRKYCDYAAEFMRDVEKTAPFATLTMRKGMPFLDRNLKDILKEIQKKTEIIREQTRETQFEKLGHELNQNSQFLLEVRDPVGFKKQINIMQKTLKAICSKFPEDQKGEACELLEMMYSEPLIEDKIPLMNNILSKLSYQIDMTTRLNKFEEILDWTCINFDIFKKELNSYNIVSSLKAMKIEMEKMNKFVSLNKSSIEELNSNQNDKLSDFTSDVIERLDDIKQITFEFSKNNEKKELCMEISKLLDELEQPTCDRILQRSSAFISLFGFVASLMIRIAC